MNLVFLLDSYLGYATISKRSRPALVPAGSAPTWVVRNLGNNIITLAQPDGRRLSYYTRCDSNSIQLGIGSINWELLPVDSGTKTFQINAVVRTR